MAFKARDPEGTGFISSADFEDIMISIKSHLLTEPVKANLRAAAGGQRVSYAYFTAFLSLLSNMELIKKVAS